MLKRSVLVIAAVVALVAAAIVLLVPPAALAPGEQTFRLAWPVVRGAFHVHSQRSDGTGTLDEIAAAAAAAGLQFVIVTDHGDGTRSPEPPAYRAGVLCLDGVEISTQDGHYVALDLPATPYPLAGDSHDVVDDVRRFGGFGIVAHPGSPKPALQWDGWETSFDGIEWLNADSEWRDEVWGSLGRVLLTYAFRPVETLATLIDRPEPVLRRWDQLTATRRVPALAGADAHARLGFRQASDPYEDRVLARLPAYEVSFRAFVNHVILNGPFTGNAAIDAGLLLDGVRQGRMFTSIDGAARLTAFEAKATSGVNVARPGEYLDLQGAAAVDVQVTAPEGTTIVVVKDGEPLYETQAPAMRLDVGSAPGAYRIEARLPGVSGPGAVPWILTNPVYVGLREPHAQAAVSTPPAPATTRTPIPTESWRAEASPGSSSELRRVVLDDGTPALEWRFALAGGTPEGQYAAIRFPAGAGLADHDRLQLRARSDQPRRLWAQLRAPGDPNGERWGRTFAVDEAVAAVELRFEEFRPLGATSAPTPALRRIDSLLLVVDTLNSRPGTSGTIWIPDLWLAR